MRTTITLLFLFLAVCVLLACGTTEVVPSDTSPLPTPPSFAPTLDAATESSSSPLPNLTQEMLVPFRLEKPLHAGDTHVRGSGPPGVPIIIANITLMGEPLVLGEIGPDGHFDFVLPKPLEENYRIGLALGDLAGKPWTEDDFRQPSFYGDEAQTVPQVGFFYDSCLAVAP